MLVSDLMLVGWVIIMCLCGCGCSVCYVDLYNLVLFGVSSLLCMMVSVVSNWCVLMCNCMWVWVLRFLLW